MNKILFSLPPTRGLVKWANQTLKTAMGISLNWNQERWENNLKVNLFAHNSSIQASILHGREPQLLTEIHTPHLMWGKLSNQIRTLRVLPSRHGRRRMWRFLTSETNHRQGAGETEGEPPEQNQEGDQVLRHPGKLFGLEGRKVTSVEANNLLQLEPLDGRPLKALAPYTSVKPKRQRPSTVRAPQEVSRPPEPVSSYQSDSLCSDSEGDQLEELGVLPNTQTWIHLMSFITNHPPTFHYILYSYCCHVIIFSKCFCSIIPSTYVRYTDELKTLALQTFRTKRAAGPGLSLPLQVHILRLDAC
ncbi:uncharacterized protein LOC109909338 [Oncorhynchus kisutch]|uniref:uncharacterized protein LOC109909338 n=1 Tax=Oncorhynchus kisutch TaxID=8019 RepID=UPI0009A068CE|nr:uncharacterized protein LOC109909338 [Oncorhynchus kisutch]